MFLPENTNSKTNIVGINDKISILNEPIDLQQKHKEKIHKNNAILEELGQKQLICSSHLSPAVLTSSFVSY